MKNASYVRLRLIAIASVLVGPVGAPQHAHAQDALVTFYNQGSQLAAFVPVSKNSIFWGRVWDGNTWLVSFAESKWRPHGNRFITLHLPAGAHEFSLSNDKAPPKKGRVQVVLQPGKHYFFRTRTESWNAVVIADFRPKLDTETCKVAIVEARDAQPLKPMESPANLVGVRLTSPSFPDSCDDAATVTPTFPDPNGPAE